MNNPFFGMMGNPFQMMMQKFMQFRQSFSGNADQQIRQMMNSGKVNQQQYQQAVQMAQQFRQMFGGK